MFLGVTDMMYGEVPGDSSKRMKVEKVGIASTTSCTATT